MRNCAACESSKKQQWHGVYSFKCPECAARYLAAAWPKGKATKAHRLVYTRHRQVVQEAISKGWLNVDMESIEARAKEMVNE